MEVALRIKIAIKIVTVTRESTVQVVRANTITNPLKNLNAKMIDLVFLSLSCIFFSSDIDVILYLNTYVLFSLPTLKKEMFS